MYITKLKIKLPFDILKDKIHFIVLSLVLLAISYKHIYIIFLLIAYLLYIFIFDKKLFITSLIIIIIVSCLFLFKELNYSKPINLDCKAKVVNVEKNNSGYNIKVKISNRYLLLKTKEKYKVGSILLINGDIEEYYIQYPYAFNYQEYLHYNNIVGVINNPDVIVLKNQFSIHFLHYSLNNYIENKFNDSSKKYIKTLTIGNDDLLDTTNISKIGISHLFVISGLHINILIIILEKILGLFKVSEKVKKVIILIFCFSYVVLADFMISIIRVCLTLLLKFIFMNKLSNLDIICLNIIIVLIFNPYYIYNLSFILTYLISFFMLIYKDIINTKYKILNKILNMFLLTFVIQILTLPITISINPDFNIVSILVNPIFIYFVTYLFLPLSFIVLIFSFLSPVYDFIVVIFEYLVYFASNIEFLTISLGNINIYFKVLYYLVFYISFRSIYNKKYKYLNLLLVFFILWYNKGLFNLTNRIYFLDLPQGESTLIVSKNNSTVILIDTAEVSQNNELTKILKNLGIKKVDYMIITHSDSDHIGGAIDLVKYIKVKNIVFNKYDKVTYIDYFKKFCKNIYYLENDNKIKNKKFELKVLSPNKDYLDINDNSLVFIIEVFNIKLLMTGDISTKVEKNIIKDYKIDVDFYKVAHHGSTTSTSSEFINNIKYDYAVIMSGYYNKFGFPKKEIIEKFSSNKLLTTKQLGTIIVEVKKNKFNLIYSKK